MSKVQVVKAVVIDSRTYRTAKHAANAYADQIVNRLKIQFHGLMHNSSDRCWFNQTWKKAQRRSETVFRRILED